MLVIMLTAEQEAEMVRLTNNHVLLVHGRTKPESECILAESGYYSLGTTTLNGVVTNLANQQVACGSGYYSLYQESTPGSSRNACNATQAGYYSNGTITVNGAVVTSTAQVPCPAGTYQANEAQASCTIASAGFYANGTQGGFNVASSVTGDSTEQERCYEGTWQNQTGQASCHLAESGYYSIGTQTYNGSVTYLSLQQVPCPAGTYSNYLVSTPGIDRVSCTDVDAGYYSNGTVVVNGVAVNATNMTPCPAGTYQPDEGKHPALMQTLDTTHQVQSHTYNHYNYSNMAKWLISTVGQTVVTPESTWQS